MAILLQEYLNPAVMNSTIVEDADSKGGKNLYLKGICIQGDVKNANGRVYPLTEISRAVKSIKEQLEKNIPILGEIDHPSDLKINLDRVSHCITDMWMDGANGCGKLKIIPTPMGNVIKAMLESDVKLGVSSRGSGNVDDYTGKVSDFEIITVDIVAQPSAPNAWPRAIYEGMMNMRHGHRLLDIAKDVNTNSSAQKYLKEQVIRLIKDLKL